MIARVPSLIVLLITFVCPAGDDNVQAAPPITALAFTPEQSEVLVGSQAGVEVRAWPSLKINRTLSTELEHIHDFVFAGDGRSLIVVGGSPAEWGGFEQMEWPTGKVLHRSTNHSDVAYKAAFGGGDTELSVVAADKIVAHWSRDKQWTLKERVGHSRPVLAITYLKQSDQFLSAGEDQTLRLWDRQSDTPVRTLTLHTGPVLDLVARPGDQTLATVASAGADRTIRFWQPTIGRMMRFVRLDNVLPLSLAWTADGEMLVVAGSDGALRVVDPATATIRQTSPAIDGWAYEVIVSPQDIALVGGANGQLKRVKLSR